MTVRSIANDGNHEEYLTTRQVAERYPIAEATLRGYRHAGIGPRSFKLGRKVLYLDSDVREWLEQEKARTERGGGAVA